MSTEEIPTPTQEVDGILRKVRALLGKADSTDSPEEAEALRLKAEKMMVNYAIDQAMLDASRPAEKRMKPEVAKLTVFPANHPFSRTLAVLVMYVADHCRVRVMFHNYMWGYGDTTVTVVGYPHDIRFFEMLYTTLFLHLSGDITPDPDFTKGFDENVYILHEAGIKWEKIARRMNAAYIKMVTVNHANAPAWRKAVRVSKAQPDALVPWPDGHRLINAYKRHCKAIGEEPQAIMSPDVYQRSFAEGFLSRIWTRLYDLRTQTKDMTGSSLVLRQESVDEMFNEMFPPVVVEDVDDDEETPKRKKARIRRLRVDENARDAGRASANRADLGGSKVSGGKRALS